MVFHKTFTCWLREREREREGQRLCCLGSKLGRERDRKDFAMPSSTIPRLTFVYVKSIRALSLRPFRTNADEEGQDYIRNSSCGHGSE